MSCFCRRFARAHLLTAWVITTIVALMLTEPGYTCAQGGPVGGSGSAQVAKAVGVIKTVQADSITVAAESGGEVRAMLMASTKILRVPPGEKDLKNATALQAQDLQPGDRVLVRGQASTDGEHTTIIAALAVIVMKQADVAAKQQHDRDDWQKRGVGGLVSKVDAATGTITISSGGLGANRSIAVHVAGDTILRRYAPGSVRFDDAKLAPVDQIKVGDQLRARGTRNPDGGELSAEEVVSGTFRNIAGTIKAIDAVNNTMTVQDAISKSAVVVNVSADSQMKKLPAEMALRIAMRLKGAAAAGNGEQRSGNSLTQGGPPAVGGARPGSGPGGNGPPDFQRLLSRLPDSKLVDLQKGDAVMIVATEGGNVGAITAVTTLAGVEAILTAAPNQSASTLLSPWSLNTSGGEGEAAPQ